MKLTGAHRLEGPSGAPDHECHPVPAKQLRMTNDPVSVDGAEPLAKSNAPHSQSIALGTSV